MTSQQVSKNALNLYRLILGIKLVDLVKAYAFDHANEEDWNRVSLSYSEIKIARIIKGARTKAEAISKMEQYLRPNQARAQDVVSDQ